MKTILVAPLDWGLGHATRCIPIIRELLSIDCKVMIGGSGRSLHLLAAEFPFLKAVELPAYNPEYPKAGSMAWKMLSQLPKFFSAIRQEHHYVERLVRQEGINAIISDNRFGCWSTQVPTVFITHQSNIMMPRRFGWLGGFVRSINWRYIHRFSRCWIPDTPNLSLAGELASFDKSARLPVEYIGPLSRFSPSKNVDRMYDVVVIFSGPEPQRSIFERIVLPQLKTSSLNFFVVRGVIEDQGTSEPNVRNYLTSVIARSGYSTVMDLMTLRKKAIFVPTPGQTEQEYLATRLAEQKIAYAMNQNNFDLKLALREVQKYQGFNDNVDYRNHLHSAIKTFLNSLES
jgi:hypothetical protein